MEYCVLDATHLQITWVRVTYLVGLGVTLDLQIELMHLRIRDIMTDNIVATMIRTLTQSTGTPLMINQHNKPDGLRTNLNRINSRSSLKLRTIGIIRGNQKITAKAKAVIFKTTENDSRNIQVGARLFPFRKHWRGAAHEGIVRIGLS